ncbi:MAG: ABC transporter permease [Gaiellaceae bacterium]
MALFLVRRVAWMIVMFLSVTVVTFIIFFVIPSEDDQASLGRGGADVDVRTTVQIDGPIYEEYAEFVQKIVTQGSLGNSWVLRGQEVNELLVRAAPVTLSLVIGGALLWMLIAIPTGVLSALRPRSATSRFTTVFVLIGISAHPLWMGLMLSYLFGARLGLTPTGGYCEVFSPAGNCGGPAQWAYHLILPWFTFALMYAAIYTRMIRASTLETLDEDYVRTARAKGAPEWMVIRSHVLRNAMLPVVTMLGMDIAVSLGAVLFVESAYGLPGLGRLFATSLARRDFPVLLGITMYTTFVVILVNFLIDILYGFVDPQARIGSRSERAPSRAERAKGVPDSATQPAT